MALTLNFRLQLNLQPIYLEPRMNANVREYNPIFSFALIRVH
jgi:hypothetical protein